MVRNWHCAQRVAHERRRDELVAAGKDRERPRREEAGIATELRPRWLQSAGVLRAISLTGLWRICHWKASPYTWLSQQWSLSMLAPRSRQDREIPGSPTRRSIVIRLALST